MIVLDYLILTFGEKRAFSIHLKVSQKEQLLQIKIFSANYILIKQHHFLLDSPRFLLLLEYFPLSSFFALP